ncbi:MAG: aldo/keto reductase family protein [Planctomycetes bacterium]|nr:aldo/keto reductase family protein [Planctomycetota bacterium]
MEYSNLGHSGLKVSRIALGSWLTFGHSVADDETRKCVYTAIENGINFIDTADIYNYGEAEKSLSKVIADFPRHSLVIASKAFFPMDQVDKNNRGLSRKHLTESIDKTLQRLGTDYLDLYQCHRPDFYSKTPVEETVNTMDTLIKQGKILYWGVSCWTAAQITEAVYLAKLMNCQPPVSNQPHYSMLYRKIEEEVIPTCERLGLSQIVFSPLEQGILTGKYNKEVPKDSRFANDKINLFMHDRMNEENLAKVRELETLALELGVSCAQLALAFVLRKKNVASAIVGVSKDSQLMDNLKALEIDYTEELSEKVEAIFANKPEPKTHGCM